MSRLAIGVLLTFCQLGWAYPPQKLVYHCLVGRNKAVRPTASLKDFARQSRSKSGAQPIDLDTLPNWPGATVDLELKRHGGNDQTYDLVREFEIEGKKVEVELVYDVLFGFPNFMARMMEGRDTDGAFAFVRDSALPNGLHLNFSDGQKGYYFLECIRLPSPN